MRSMDEILVVVQPVFDVITDGSFDESGLSEGISVKSCYNCGSPLMYIRQERCKGGAQDFTWFCAVCGREQMGVMIDVNGDKHE